MPAARSMACQLAFGYRMASLEHLRRRADGGDDAPANLAMACAYCNSSRRDAPPERHRAAMLALVAAGRHPCFPIENTRDVLHIKSVMILSFGDKATAEFAAGQFSRAFSGFERQAFKRLEILDAATSLEDLRGLPSNRLEVLRGDRSGLYSIRINLQWRLCFEWRQDDRGPSNVVIVDYH